jgi:hypothetical protein
MIEMAASRSRSWKLRSSFSVISSELIAWSSRESGQLCLEAIMRHAVLRQRQPIGKRREAPETREEAQVFRHRSASVLAQRRDPERPNGPPSK